MSGKNVSFNTILAISRNYGIGYQGALPWKLKQDMQFFKKITSSYGVPSPSEKQNVVIMGRKTWESIPSIFKPLKDRINIVITSKPKNIIESTHSLGQKIYTANNLDNALALIEQELFDKVSKTFLIGGAQLYEESFEHPNSNELFLTRVNKNFECDKFLPSDFLKNFEHLETSKTYSENHIPFDFSRYINKSQLLKTNQQDLKRGVLPNQHEEYQYLELIKDIITNGTKKEDRTGVGTHSLFGRMMKFDLSQSFPLLTTKDVFWRGVVEELLWFIRGETDSKTLSAKKVKIWDAHGSREFLDKLGFKEREEGDLGPVYGFQWKHFGANYINNKTDYTNEGVNQLKEIIQQIKKDPNSRRLILSAWNPVDLPKMALPPCHVLAHFYVANNKLSCLLYQRSADVGLGVPFNIASYALLTCIIADVSY